MTATAQGTISSPETSSSSSPETLASASCEMPALKAPGTSSPKWVDVIEPVKDAFALVVGLAAISYAFGFVTINSFLSAHGTVVYNANSEFLAAGLSFWLFGIVIAIMVVLPGQKVLPSEFLDRIKKEKDNALNEQLKKYEDRNEAFKVGFKATFSKSFYLSYGLFYVLSYVFGLIVRYGIALFLLGKLIIHFYASAVQPFFSLYFFAWVCCTIIATSGLVDLVRNQAWVWAPVTLLAVGISAFSYGRGLYPYLPTSLGGAEAVQVRLVIDPKDKRFVEAALRLPLVSGATPDVQLFFETSEYFFILIKRGGLDCTVQLKKDVVKGIIYPGSSDRLAPSQPHNPAFDMFV